MLETEFLFFQGMKKRIDQRFGPIRRIIILKMQSS